MSEKEMRKLCALWQRRLRLQDWNVRLLIKSADDIDGSFARIRPQLDAKCAILNVCEPGDHSSLDLQMIGERDVEEDIVHELLHLHCEPFSPEDHDSLEYQAIEQAVGVLANCIVRLSREK